jgi:hypothetical protein
MAQDILPQKWGYIYGTSGEIWTAARQQEITRSRWDDPDYANSIQYGAQWIGHMVADCSGLVCYILRKHGIKLPHGSNSMWNEMRENGKIAVEPPAGALVFKLRNGSDYYHVGIYVGDGAVVEAQGAKSGVVKSSLKTWTHYGLIRGVEYKMPEPIKPGAAVVTATNGKPVRMRTEPGGTVIANLPVGTEVEIVQTDGEWCKIRADGWMMSKFLKERG